jgi:prepilin-type processing-associated H-X9-DG protein
MGATDILGRIATSFFRCEAFAPVFSCCHDVPNGGVLLALPALLAVGLLVHTDKYFELPRGFYRHDTIFLLLAFMALARLKTVEDLRYCSPGEWGKLLGVDRIPEAKTLRGKVGILSDSGKPREWAGELCRDWMMTDPDSAGILYVDGHVRVYHGSQTELPRHYVSRQKLCQRATVDYWVNAMDGQPFFVINKAVDPGLLQVLEREIVPRLEREVPKQVSLFGIDAVPSHRFTIVFDREGYSPAFMGRMKEKGIACQTYNKHPGADWPEEEFKRQSVKLQAGNVIEMRLAERGVFLGGELWVREIRKLTKSGHQTSILSSDFINDCGPVSAAMFARWSQENFFGYMRQHYNLDRLIDYSTEEISATTKVVNPQYREVDGQVRAGVAKLNRKQKEFGAIILQDTIEPDQVVAYEQKKAGLQEEITVMEKEVEDLKACRSATAKHVTMADLPEEERFRQLGVRSKYFIDTIKMIAYRAETAMAGIVREKLSRHDDARSLLRAIYATEADIVPDEASDTFTVRLHQLANRMSGEVVQHLCNELNATLTLFPGTNMRLFYELVS